MNDFGEWKVKISDEFQRFGTKVFIFRRLPNGVETYDPSTELIEGIPDGTTDARGLYFPEEMLEALFQALQARGYKPNDQSFIEGQVQAQSEHLKDLRKLLKL